MKRKLIAYTLLISLLAAVSCKGETPDTPRDSTDTTSAPEETTESLYTDLGEHDFGGRKFTIVYSADQLGSFWPYDAEAENGDIVNDAVYKRNRTVEEEYKVDIDYHSTGGVNSEVGEAFLQSILAGDNEFDLALTHMFSGVNPLISSKALYNFNDLPVVDFDKPWWAQHLRDTLEVDGILLLHSSDLVYKFNDCIYFNRGIMEDNNLDADLYELVKEGKWTWDKLISMAKSVSNDLNGDGKYDENDMYGLALVPNEAEDSNWVYANGLTIASVEDGRISMTNVKSERMKSVVDFMDEFVNNGNHVYISGAKSLQDAKVFLDGHSLFMENLTLILPEMRDSKIDFGIVPLPKYDESQTDYRSMATTQMMALPATLDDPEFTGVILEALSMESYRTLNPAVYEISMTGKYLRDEESYKMYQIIQNSGIYDFNWNYGAGNCFALMMRDMVRKKSADKFMSYCDENIPAVQTLLENVLTGILSYKD